MNFREVHDQDSQPLFLNRLAVERERDLRGGRQGVCERGGKVRHRPEQAFRGLCPLYDCRVVPGTRHDAEAFLRGFAVIGAKFDFGHVEIERDSGAQHLRERMGLVGRCKVQREKICGACGKGHNGNSCAGKGIRGGRDRSVAAARDDRVKVASVGDQAFVPSVERRQTSSPSAANDRTKS